MGSRERKRVERSKRKRRGAEPADESFQERVARRSEARNAAVRAELEPLPQGERPRAVTVAAVASVVVALVFTVSTVIAATGALEIRDEEPTPIPLLLVAGVLWLMAWGLWKARYWAVLGFQTLLLLVILSSSLGLVQISTVPEALATLMLLAGSATLFYFMIRAMARIQMPDRPGS